jgi:predicted Zn-dependent protease
MTPLRRAYPWIEDLLVKARDSGAVEAEVFHKTGRGRRIVLEPSRGSGVAARLTVSTSEEEGVALRLQASGGGWGLAWASPATPQAAFDLVESALASAGHSRLRGLDRESGTTGIASTAPACATPGDDGPEAGRDLGIFDPRVLAETPEKIAELLAEAGDAALSIASGSARLDRAVLSEAVSSVTLANSLGFRGSFRKSLALLSLSVAPAAPGATATLEERAACRLEDLRPRECGIDAALRAAAPRPPVPPPAGGFPLVLSPRAAAGLVSAVVPWLLTNDPPQAESLGSISICDDPGMRGASGTVPFDGVGRTARRVALIESGRIVGLPLPGRGNVVRLSFRDFPAWGLTNLTIGAEEDPHLTPNNGIHLRVSAAQFVPGRICLVRILRGEWYRGGAPAGSADGLVWEGPLVTLLSSVVGAGADARPFFVGLTVQAPSLRLEGLSPWVVAGTGAHAGASRSLAPEQPRSL